ncbi:hypothetical protein LJC42_02035 [Eubacteriales bacterium OttesenSCG-928-K08]|nr:hypothetical protein [Eubacteriales bacterium OttesenSCG-928-K08]
MSKGVWILVIVMVVLIIAFGVFYLLNRPTYGNDTAGIEKAIQENGGSGKTVVIIDSVVMAGSKYVGFLEGDDTLGLAVFYSDGRGNFVFENIHREEGATSTSFYEPFASDIEGTHGADIVISKDPLLSKVVRTVDGEVFDEYDVVNSPTVLVMEFHHTESSLNVQVLLYDLQGNEILKAPSRL